MTDVFVDVLYLSGTVMIATCTVALVFMVYDFLKGIFK